MTKPTLGRRYAVIVAIGVNNMRSDNVPPSIDHLAAQLMKRADELATHTEAPGGITRRYGTPALAEVMEIVEGWMREAGMTTRRDAIGNLYGLQHGASHETPRLLLGGHLDSVRDAGRYDGILGVLSAIATVEFFRASSTGLPFALEVVAFADEEGVRFHSLYLGSSSATGTLPAEILDVADADGITVRDAIREFGFDPEGAITGSLTDHRYVGFIEAHIEQGPRLEAADCAVGIVSGIVATRRAYLDIYGVAGHAGTVAMEDRHDALVTASEIILAIDAIAREIEDARATVGELTVKPGASNVIAGEVRLSLDVRHPDGAMVDEIYDRIRHASGAVAAERQMEIVWRTGQKVEAMVCDADLNRALTQVISDDGPEPMELFSGAGHDAAALGRIMPSTMLFVRCKDGISHNPAESITTDDAATTIDILTRFAQTLATSEDK
ncbi:MAG: M20 family metallo-hydrolase [Chloroflexota bacterium]|nr:M20 family metallo-hydrolase [Chloroflexota bacterium]